MTAHRPATPLWRLIARWVKHPAFLALMLALPFTVGVVAWSEEQGKLSVMPDYDDSHSLVEGVLRWSAFQQGGLAGLISDYLGRMPHSFLHYYWTSLLFGVSGVHEVVPYAANGLFDGEILAFPSMEWPSLKTVAGRLEAAGYLGPGTKLNRF